MPENSPPQPQNVQTTTQGPVVTYDSPEETIPNMAISSKKSLKDRIKLPESMAKYKKFIKLGMTIFVVFIVLLIVLSIAINILRRNGNGLISTPTPTPSEQTDEISNPSIYANDPEVAIITEEIQKLDENLKDSNYRESTLSLPILDWNVNF